MEQIAVNEYGRTNLGNIIKFAWFYNKETNERDKNKVVLIDLMKTETRPFYYFKKEEHIVKHSPNIIDLIETGDYVNGHRVTRIDNNTTIWLETGNMLFGSIYENEIKTILTKEQYTANCYEVK